MAESFEDFKDSFSYGSRGDLSFKFLKKLDSQAAAEAIRQILEAIGTSFDTGDVAELHDLITHWQTVAYTPDESAPRRYVYDATPFTPLAKPLAECRVGLLTSSGHFVAGDDPEPFGVRDMTQVEAVERIADFMKETPVLSVIPGDFRPEDLRVRHGGYDIRSAVMDYNVVFPRDALVAAARDGRIGGVAHDLHSFPGATSQGRLRKKALPGWIDMLTEADIDVLLLVPV